MPMKNKTILFLPSNGNQVKIFNPISNLLEKNYHILYVSQGSFKDEGAEHELQFRNINFKKFDEFTKQDPKFIIEQENVGLIVVGNDTDVIPQWFISSSHKLQIPSLLIQDGLLFDVKKLNNDFLHHISILINKRSKKLLKLALKLKLSHEFKKIKYGQGGCNQIHVWGKMAEEYLLKRNVPKSSIKISGNTKFQTKNEVSSMNSKQTNEITILYAPTDLIQTSILDQKTVLDIVHDLCESVLAKEENHLVIKPHPIENTKFYNSFQKKYGPRIEIVNEEIGSLITKSDIVITNLSTVSMEALQKRKPVVIFLPKIEKIVNPNSFPLDLIEKGVFLYARDKQDLTEKIDNILSNGFEFSSSKLQIISDYLGVQENAVSNIVNSIEEILKK